MKWKCNVTKSAQFKNRGKWFTECDGDGLDLKIFSNLNDSVFYETWFQLQKLLESLEIHMIHDVQKKIKQEMTLVISERARQESSLPTGKKS